MQIVGVYVAALVTFLALDAIWLGVVARNFYKTEIGDLLLPRPDFAIAGIFYAFYVAGILFFAVWPGLAAGSWLRTGLAAAALGLLAYGTYDLTNLATLKGFTVRVAAVDMIWGAAVTAATALVAHATATILAR